MDLTKEYATGVGHIDERNAPAGRFLVSFYGRRVEQTWAETWKEARKALTRLAKNAR